MKKWLKPLLFTLGGGLAGLASYYFVGCSTGSCPITSNPWVTLAYTAAVGLILSAAFTKPAPKEE